MPGSWPPGDLPHLVAGTYIETSPSTRKYNCIAWVAGNDTRKWWPDPFGIGYWPSEAPREVSIQAFIGAFEQQGYELCADGELEDGFEKVALFAEVLDDGSLSPTHAAIQLANGHWSSKLGDFEDVEHFLLESVNGPIYGRPARYLRRIQQNEQNA